MNVNGDIIIIEDDEDDREILEHIVSKVLTKNEYTNNIVFIKNGLEALEYLGNIKEQPFIVISDINMPKMDGFELREIVYNDPVLKHLCIPYVFLTTSAANVEYIKEAYNLSVQGFFTKLDDPDKYEMMFNDLIRYWKHSLKPVL